MRRALVLITCLMFTGAAMAQYKWVDKNGKVQYGDTPPTGANATAVRPPPSQASEPEPKRPSARTGPASIAEKDAQFRKRQQEAEKEREKQAQVRQDAEDKRENCARAQEALRALQTGRVTRTDAKGERHFLNDTEISQETAKARQSAQQWCN